MKIILKENNYFILRFDTGEEVISVLARFCKEEAILAGFFLAIGSSGDTVVSYYNLQTKQYEDHEIKKRLEITSLVGNVSVMDGQPVVHAHGTFADEKLGTVGGHVKSLTVSATCEMALTRLEGRAERVRDAGTGLNLLD